ncbi:alpha carbonic anhydrase 7-like [Papaver somniferum]|uniref:alpha carbonic anhydrase 7-like n=1 Tax=Papaver somniferum TaxID=3469 RepID=UPI000E6FBF49|nr:alpha carbonic anhydrase 7-like [Papaver somniferum]
MKNFVSKPINLVYTYLLTAVLVLTHQGQHLLENQEDFSYVIGSQNGPKNWGDLRAEWATCKTGTEQSPIDLAFSKMRDAPELGDLQTNYTPASGILENIGYRIRLQWVVAGNAGSIQINNITYVLDNIHWHSPSEHTINGMRFSLEQHLVHKNVQLQKVAVVAVLYAISVFKDQFLSKLEDNIVDISGTGAPSEVNIGLIDPNDIDMSDRRYYRYLGSLTTPPCDDGVIWTIKKKVMPVRRDQVMLLRNAVHDGNENNARPLQPLNNRDILYYSPLHTSSSVDNM